jgi:hypothetical protein
VVSAADHDGNHHDRIQVGAVLDVEVPGGDVLAGRASRKTHARTPFGVVGTWNGIGSEWRVLLMNAKG